MNLDELIALLPELNETHLKCFWQAHNNQWIANSPELFNLIEKNTIFVYN